MYTGCYHVIRLNYNVVIKTLENPDDDNKNNNNNDYIGDEDDNGTIYLQVRNHSAKTNG